MALNAVEVLLIGALIKIREEGPDEQCYGLCWSIEEFGGYFAKMEFRNICMEWPKYSGDPEYPINGVDGLNPKDSYVKAKVNETQWDSSTKYGQLRYELLDFCINYLNQKEKG